MTSPRARLLVALAPWLLLVAACSDGGVSSRSPDGGQVDVGPLPRPDEAGVLATAPAPTDGTATSPPGSSVSSVSSVPIDTTPPTVPTSGVPGVDDAGALCESWSRLNGTRQVLTLAANFGELGDDGIARLELIAAPLVLAAVDGLDAALGEVGTEVTAIADERDAVIDELFGRMVRRADAAVAALGDLGPPDGTAELLAQVWLDGLRSLEPDAVQPVLADLGPELGPLVEQAASVFADDAPRWNEDPDLDVADVSIPATTTWIGDRCPDLSVIGVGDAV